MGRLVQRYGGTAQGSWGQVDEDLNDKGMWGKPPVHGVTQDVSGAE